MNAEEQVGRELLAARVIESTVEAARAAGISDLQVVDALLRIQHPCAEATVAAARSLVAYLLTAGRVA